MLDSHGIVVNCTDAIFFYTVDWSNDSVVEIKMNSKIRISLENFIL